MTTISHNTIWRDACAAVCALSLVLWAGTVIRSGGYAGWLIYPLVVIFTALCVCLIARRFPVFFGALVAGCIVVSLSVDYVRDEWGHPYRSYHQLWNIYWQEFSIARLLVYWLFTFALSLIVSLPIYAYRQKHKTLPKSP
jgi:hypothetical protein